MTINTIMITLIIIFLEIIKFNPLCLLPSPAIVGNDGVEFGSADLSLYRMLPAERATRILDRLVSASD
jgi:hypothetical protein